MMTSKSNIVAGEFDRSWLIRLIDRIQVWNDRRKAEKQLRAMPDRLLKDIGIERFEISEAVKRPAGVSRLATMPEQSDNVTEIKRAA